MTKLSSSNHLRRCIAAVGALFVSVVALCAAAPGAFAMHLVTPDESGTVAVHHSGMATWEMALIAVGGVIVLGLISLATVALVRSRSAAHVQGAVS